MVCLTFRRPSVSVPVLSNTASVATAKVSKACGPATNTPCAASLPVDAARAVGVASDRAHGQVMTSSETVIHKA